MQDIQLLSQAVNQLNKDNGSRLHPSTVYRHGRQGRIALYKLGGKWAVSVSELRHKYGVQRVRFGVRAVG